MNTGRREHISRQDILLVSISILASIVMLFIPTGFEPSEASPHSMRVHATVLDVDDSQVREYGPVIEGTQHLELRIGQRQIQRRGTGEHQLNHREEGTR